MSTSTSGTTTGRGPLGALARGLASGGFAVFLVTVALLFTAVLAALLLWPAAPSGVGAFAEDFRLWCFGLEQGRGVPLGYVLMTVVSPLVFSAVVVLAYLEPLREIARGRRPWVPGAAAALVVVLAAAAGLSAVAEPPAARTSDLPFPAADLRTAVPAPEISLVNQEGDAVSLQALSGHVVLVTGLYSRCSSTCPMLFGQATRALDALDPAERSAVTVLAVTLDPEHDTPERLAALAAARSLAAPGWNLLTGEPEVVERTLDRMGIERHRDPATGVIDHANVFLVIDRAGRVAYRFSLGDLQERWLVEALELLVAERAPAT